MFVEELKAEVVDLLPEGIIIMDKERTIHYMNEQAVVMTGWKLGETVPYCTYCMQRKLENRENECIFEAGESLPSFHSRLAVYKGIEEFEVSLKKLNLSRQNFLMLKIQKPVIHKRNESDRFNELLVQKTMLAQEAERKRIARELHDHIGQSVYSIFLGLEVIKQKINEEKYQNHVINMINVMEKTLHDIKHLTKSLRPDMVHHLGLKKSIQEAVRDWKKLYQIDITVEMDIQENVFDPEKELHLFRVIQESVNNAVRHGHASNISIHLKCYNKYVFFHIYDNGCGFSPDKNKFKGLGLKHMYERCKILEGDIRWSSKAGGPTRVEGFVSLLKGEGESGNERNDC